MLIHIFCGFFFFCYLHVVLISSVRQRKDELEQRMSTLQESRRELMVQLEQLMMLLKVQQTRVFICLTARLQNTIKVPLS